MNLLKKHRHIRAIEEDLHQFMHVKVRMNNALTELAESSKQIDMLLDRMATRECRKIREGEQDGSRSNV